MLYIQLLFLLLISANYIFGLSKLPFCQCECCPGDHCQTQLLIFSIDNCNETTCSFDECYRMYPKKCGLTPGFTNSSCSVVNSTTRNSSDVKLTLLHNATSSNIILPIMIIMNLIFCLFS
jgi:hypothetical protein